MKNLLELFKTILGEFGYINNPIAYIEDSMKDIEKIQHTSIFFININTKIRGNLVSIEDRVEFFQSSVAHRYLVYTITTPNNKDKIFIKLRLTNTGSLDTSYDKITKRILSSEYSTSSNVTKFGGTIDLYDKNFDKKLIRFFVKTMYKVNNYVADNLPKNKK